MKRSWREFIAHVLLLFALSAFAGRAEAQGQPTLFIYSTIDALMAGSYEGDLTIRELAVQGDFGIGTFNRLDGELIALDGTVYRAKADGTVAVAGPDEKTPLAFVARFQPTLTVRLNATLSLAELEDRLDREVRNPNLFYAVRIDGEFRRVSVRAIAPQSKPYLPLAAVSKTQSVHNYPSLRGTLIGIRSPAFSKGIAVPGYHWHLLSADRQRGGHVLGLTLAAGTALVESIPQVRLQLPTSEGFAHSDQTEDRSVETRQVEGSRDGSTK
jgi:acetolactate decarboxylase